MVTDFVRLSDDTEPLSYKLTMERDFTRNLTLPSPAQWTSRLQVMDENTNRSIGVRSWTYDEDREQVTISLNGHVLASRVYMILTMMKMAFKSNSLIEYRKNSFQCIVYQNEVKDYKKWYHNGSPETIWEHINVLTKGLPLDPSDVYTKKHDSSASSRLHNNAVILQILALSVSVKLLVHVI
ncbi:hypothetical protein AGLY_006093 [Aphis glycines]|uniref:Uncharacterized protein n=1 Tax=Aphis glycines TaxID=307491 RepID=A0A6G0TSS6_APHGL|nr:hypothetical protein AGLY_006093 [Aphis glycines]